MRCGVEGGGECARGGNGPSCGLSHGIRKEEQTGADGFPLSIPLHRLHDGCDVSSTSSLPSSQGSPSGRSDGNEGTDEKGAALMEETIGSRYRSSPLPGDVENGVTGGEERRPLTPRGRPFVSPSSSPPCRSEMGEAQFSPFAVSGLYHSSGCDDAGGSRHGDGEEEEAGRGDGGEKCDVARSPSS